MNAVPLDDWTIELESAVNNFRDIVKKHGTDAIAAELVLVVREPAEKDFGIEYISVGMAAGRLIGLLNRVHYELLEQVADGIAKGGSPDAKLVQEVRDNAVFMAEFGVELANHLGRSIYGK